MTSTTTNGGSASTSKVLKDTSPTRTLKVADIICDYSINARNGGKTITPHMVEGLAASIKQNKLIQNPAVWMKIVPPKKEGEIGSVTYQVIAGFRRYTACTKNLGWIEIDCKCIEADSLQEAIIKNLVENEEREPLRPYDLAMSCLELKKNFGMTGRQIGARIGKSKQNANNIIRAAENLHEDILAAWKEKEYPLDDLVRLAAKEKNEQVALFQVITGDASKDGSEGDEEDAGKGKGKKPKKAAKKAAKAGGKADLPRMLRREHLETFLALLLKKPTSGSVLIDAKKGKYTGMSARDRLVAATVLRGALGLHRYRHKVDGETVYDTMPLFKDIGEEKVEEAKAKAKAETAAKKPAKKASAKKKAAAKKPAKAKAKVSAKKSAKKPTKAKASAKKTPSKLSKKPAKAKAKAKVSAKKASGKKPASKKNSTKPAAEEVFAPNAGLT